MRKFTIIPLIVVVALVVALGALLLWQTSDQPAPVQAQQVAPPDQAEMNVPLPRVQAAEVTAAEAQAAIDAAQTLWNELNALPVPADEQDAEHWVDALEESASELFVANARFQDGGYEAALEDAEEAKQELEPILIIRALGG